MRHRFLLVALIALSTILVPLSLAPRVQSLGCPVGIVCWANPGTSGDWEVASNWSLARVPTASDDVAILGSNTYVVTLSSVQTVHSLYIGAMTGQRSLDCTSSCTLTILSHTPGWPYDLAQFDVIDIYGNIINHAQFIDSAGTINIHSGGTFVNHNTLDISQLGSVVNNLGVFDEKCGASVVGGPISGTVVTESPCPTQVSTASGSPVSGTVLFQSELGAFTSITATALSSVLPAPPSGPVFPDGLFSFTISGLQTGATVTVTITLPSPLPAGAFAYWKFHSGTWTSITECALGGCAFLSSDRKTITLILTDGVSPDDSDGAANGVIVDPGGAAIIPAIIPEFPIGLPLLAIFMIIAYGLIKRRTVNPKNI